jgi:YjjG family noncanonical pyrimidine nucleotidase
MKFNPKAIFFDWDHTLWDHDRNAREVILDLVDEFNLTNMLEADQNDIWNSFNVLNNQLWDDYQSKKITQLELRESRFELFFSQLGYKGDPQKFSSEFLYRTPRKKHLLGGASEIIEELALKYPLFILTNGFEDIQFVKVEASGLKNYFQAIITSQEVGTQKPDIKFFEYALKRADCLAHEVVMVGDHPIADIHGAENAGIRSIHLNLYGIDSTAQIQIKHLTELRDYLL